MSIFQHNFSFSFFFSSLCDHSYVAVQKEMRVLCKMNLRSNTECSTDFPIGLISLMCWVSGCPIHKGASTQINAERIWNLWNGDWSLEVLYLLGYIYFTLSFHPLPYLLGNLHVTHLRAGGCRDTVQKYPRWRMDTTKSRLSMQGERSRFAATKSKKVMSPSRWGKGSVLLQRPILPQGYEYVYGISDTRAQKQPVLSHQKMTGNLEKQKLL